MATIFLDDGTADRTYVAKFVNDSDGTIWNGSTWVAANTLTTTALNNAVNGVTLSAVTNASSAHIGYQLTVPAGITVPCHVSVYLTSYAAGDEEDYGYDYDPQAAQILEDTGTTLPATLTTISGYVDCLPASWVTVPTAAEIKTAMEAAGGHLALILADTGTDGVVLSTAVKNAVADAVLARDVSNAEPTESEHTLRFLVLMATEANTTDNDGYLTVYQTDGATEVAQKTLTADADANPVTGVS